MKKLVMLALLVALTWTGLTLYDGYRMYKDALAAEPLEEKADSVLAKDHFTSISQLPKTYIDAVLAVEDRQFYQHMGISFRSTGRAILRDLKE